MTKQEAIRQIINGEWRKSENNNKSNIESICEIVGQIEPKWHPYPEEKPKEGGAYLVSLLDDDIDVRRFDSCYGAFGHLIDFGIYKYHGYFHEFGDILAWMELPKPYKEEKK